VTGNVGGNTKKMVASAVVFIGVGLGTIIGPYAFLSHEAPHYTTGVIVCMISRIAEVRVISVLPERQLIGRSSSFWFFVSLSLFRTETGTRSSQPAMLRMIPVSSRTRT